MAKAMANTVAAGRKYLPGTAFVGMRRRVSPATPEQVICQPFWVSNTIGFFPAEALARHETLAVATAAKRNQLAQGRHVACGKSVEQHVGPDIVEVVYSQDPEFKELVNKNASEHRNSPGS